MLQELLNQIGISSEELAKQEVLPQQALRSIDNIFRGVELQIVNRQRVSYAYDDVLAHSKRVAIYSSAVARRYSQAVKELPFKQYAEIAIAAALHDIEKLYWPYSLLRKPKDKITSDDWMRITQHPDAGAGFIEQVTSREISQGIVGIIRQHHENIDGTGYPNQKSGDNVCLGARIVRITDSFDTMTSSRPYEHPLNSIQEAIDKLEKSFGKYDKAILGIFKEILQQPLE